jgi:hypothetical protein
MPVITARNVNLLQASRFCAFHWMHKAEEPAHVVSVVPHGAHITFFLTDAPIE